MKVRNFRSAASLFLALAASLALAQLQADSPWPKFHGNAQNTGTAAAGASMIEKWSFQTGNAITSSPAIGLGDMIYVGSSDFNVYAVNGATGAEKWAFTTAGAVTSSPAVGADGTVYVGSSDDNLYALNGQTGTVKWSFTTGGPVNSSPTIDSSGNVYVGSSDGSLYSLNSAGSKNWSFATTGPIQSSPALSEDGTTLYVGSEDHTVYAILASNGTQFWALTTGGAIDSSPATGGGEVYVGSADSRVYALDGSNGNEAWVADTGGKVLSSPAIGSDGTVYIGSDDGLLYAIDPTTGTANWTFGRLAAIEMAPAVTSDGTVYVDSGAAELYAVDATTGDKKWLTGPTNASLSSPSVASDGTIFVGGSDGKLYAFGNYAMTNFYTTPTSVVGSHSVSGVVQIREPAPAGGVPIQLMTSGEDVSVPGTVTVPAGKTGVSFAVQTSAVSSASPIVITATFNSASKQTTLTVNPAPISNFYVSPSKVTGGSATYGVVQLSSGAGSGGDVVSLSSDNSKVAVPSSVTIPSGKTGVSFSISTGTSASELAVTLTATLGSSSQQTTMDVEPYPITKLYFSGGNQVVGGNTAYGVVQISKPALATGEVISLFKNSTALTMPSTITIPAGATGVSFAIGTSSVAGPTNYNMTAEAGASRVDETFTVNQTSLISFYVSPSTLTGGGTTYGVLQFNGATLGPTDLFSSSTLVKVPSSANPSHGSFGVSFPITTSAVTSQTQVTLHASYGGNVVAVVVTLNP